MGGSVRSEAGADSRVGAERSGQAGVGAGLIPALTLTIVLAVAAFTALTAAMLLVVHPPSHGVVAGLVIGQNQTAKTLLYVLALLVILPLAVIAGPRLADALARGAPGVAAGPLATLLAAALVAALIAARVSASLPWGDGLGVVLVAVVMWAGFAALVLSLAARSGPASARLSARLSGPAAERGTAAALGVLLVGAVLSFTSLRSVSLPVLGAAALLAVLVLLCVRAAPAVRLPAGLGAGFDVAVVVLLILAIPNVVVFHPSPGPPNAFFVPGIIQFHQDFLLGPTNQLLGGGALMVNVPVSQYGVGYIYLLAGWFHLVPIGYGTYGFLDGLVTALFYVAGYLVLRAAATPRPLAAGALAVAVVALIYNLYYEVGALPQQGPLRFGLPMLVILAGTAACRWPHRHGVATAAGLLTLGVAAIWSLEMLAYTLCVFAAMSAVQAWLIEPGARRAWLGRRLALAVGACVTAHLILAGATLAGTGRLPDWGQYLAYVDALVLGGQKAGTISYGFARWSPDLPVAAGALASAAALVLVLRRAPAPARREPVALTAICGSTAYAIALLSYSDNRSSTYLLPYVALPTLLAGVLWLALILRSGAGGAVGAGGRVGAGGLAALAFSLAVAAVMVAAAWPRAGTDFSDTALSHAGGLGSALTRLWHPPPIDPRAPRGVALLRHYAPGHRALILLPDAPDLGTEILIRGRRTNRLSIGDPKADAFVDPSIWTGELTAQLRRLRPGGRLLTDRAGLRVAASLRGRPGDYSLTHPSGTENPQTEWILQRLAWRFRLRARHVDRSGLIVATLEPRRHG
jgi:hypothetical protein